MTSHALGHENKGKRRWKIPGRCCENGKVLPTADMSLTHTLIHTKGHTVFLSSTHTHTEQWMTKCPKCSNTHKHDLLFCYISITKGLEVEREVPRAWGDVCLFVHIRICILTFNYPRVDLLKHEIKHHTGTLMTHLRETSHLGKVFHPHMGAIY